MLERASRQGSAAVGESEATPNSAGAAAGAIRTAIQVVLSRLSCAAGSRPRSRRSPKRSARGADPPGWLARAGPELRSRRGHRRGLHAPRDEHVVVREHAPAGEQRARPVLPGAVRAGDCEPTRRSAAASRARSPRSGPRSRRPTRSDRRRTAAPPRGTGRRHRLRSIAGERARQRLLGRAQVAHVRDRLLDRLVDRPRLDALEDPGQDSRARSTVEDPAPERRGRTGQVQLFWPEAGFVGDGARFGVIPEGLREDPFESARLRQLAPERRRIEDRVRHGGARRSARLAEADVPTAHDPRAQRLKLPHPRLHRWLLHGTARFDNPRGIVHRARCRH